MARPGLVKELTAIVGREGILYAPEDLLAYEYDFGLQRGLAEAVVLPRSAQEVAQVVRLAHRHGIPIVPRGAGTGSSGGAVPQTGSVVLATSRMNRILTIRPEDRTALVEPGVVNLELSEAVAPYALYYAPDPASQRACTIGGNVATNAGGPHCLAYGVTSNHVLALEVVLEDGEIVWLGGEVPDPPGYDLRGVIIGSEGTLAIVTKALVRLLPRPEAATTLLALFAAPEEAAEAVSAIITQGIIPAALEMMDRLILEAIGGGYASGAGAVLLIEVEGLAEETASQAEKVRALCLANLAQEVQSASDQAQRERLWAGRRGAAAALGRLAPRYYILDGVVPRTRLPQMLGQVAAVGDRYGLPIATIAHAGDGNFHPNILFDPGQPGAREKVLAAGAEILRLCVEAGGTISGEHGIGSEKVEF
ncbi:MAG TPA: FAD-linked oxidase C-terminal domain-containing protein, partial [Dehalococcoidia bacterium]|nr:FAD-linked oxidase C-terminal domain-containing protein [Dehalococcoidia bacterium]